MVGLSLIVGAIGDGELPLRSRGDVNDRDIGDLPGWFLWSLGLAGVLRWSTRYLGDAMVMV